MQVNVYLLCFLDNSEVKKNGSDEEPQIDSEATWWSASMKFTIGVEIC